MRKNELQNLTLEEITELWMRLERKTLDQRKAADRFYEENLMSRIVEDFIQRNKDYVFEPVDYLILSVGTSYEPLVLNISLLKPRRILFLCTEKTRPYLEKIVQHCSLSAAAYQWRIVGETSPEDIYLEIKRAYVSWNKPKKLYIDFTGGTKAMSAAAAMAGAVIDVQLIYVGSNEYLTDFRKPKPGSESLFYIENPLKVFGDMEIEKAFTLFQRHNYSGARERLEALKESVPDPSIRQQLNFAYLLARVYEHWDALEFKAAYTAVDRLIRELERDRRTGAGYLLMDMLEHFKSQRTILYPLSELPGMLKERRNMEVISDNSYMTPLMFTMYQNALIRESQEKLDMATLLLYRLLEMIEQSRLSHYGLYVSAMNYMALVPNEQRCPEFKGLDSKGRVSLLKDRCFSIKQQLFSKSASSYLPEQISLLDGFIVLLALNDEIITARSGNSVDNLKRIRSMVYLRNNSIFAHGLGPVSAGDFGKFKHFVVELFEQYCALESISFETWQKNMRWLTPFESKNYAGMEET